MKILVTGAAGFIGSHLCEELLKNENHEVIGLDAFVSPYTPRWIGEQNLHLLKNHPRFTLIEQDLLTAAWENLLPQVEIIVHLAGMPGVRSSWGTDFAAYVTHNILATQRLLEGCRQHPVQKLIYGSTSSVYGEKTGKVNELASTQPLSPYGVTKLTGEQLCRVYHHNHRVPAVILRFFTVYGPRQRPDMAFHRFIRFMLEGQPIPVYGDGKQSRDFTFVEDCVKGIASTLDAKEIIGETINIGGKERATVLECISMIEELFSRKVQLQFTGKAIGEPKHTWADIEKAKKLLNYEPKVDLRSGLAREIADLRQLYTNS